MDAYLIENLRANGFTNEEMVKKVEKRQTEEWQEAYPQFDYSRLAEIPLQELEVILYEGYTLKFATLKGVQRLLELKFALQADEDYQLTKDGFIGLHVNQAQFDGIQTLLSANWTVQTESVQSDGSYVLNIVQTNSVKIDA